MSPSHFAPTYLSEASRLRYDVRQSARREQAMRAQSLWLARSAISAGKSGVQRAETPFGTATVKTLRQAGSVEATVELSGQKAKVTFRPNAPQGEKWSETFDFESAARDAQREKLKP